MGVRAYLLTAMMALAVVSVGITGLLIRAAVGAELKQSEAELSAQVQACISRALAEAGVAAGALALLLALPVALHMARPLRRLDDLAGRMSRGEIATSAARVGGGRELVQLGTTLQHLAATLRAQDELRRATAADVTHELRGALGDVVSRVEAIQDGIVGKSAGLRRVAVDAGRLGRIVDDVQRLVDAQRPGLLVSKDRVDLAAVVRDRVAAHAHRFAESSIALEHAIGPATVDGDRGRLAQVIDNMLSNALRYTDSGGRVKVSVTVIERECVVAVTDSGIGIDEADLPRVFDRFWRARAARERATAGSGVGLALVRDLVLAHEGRVEVVSRPGSGSRFSVHLPLHTSAEPDEPLRSAFAAGETAAAVAAWKLQRVAEIAGAARAKLP